MSQQKRNITLLISLVGLSLLSVILFLSTGSVKEVIDPTLFQLADPKTVDKVVFTRDTAKIVLEFKNGRWKVNDAYDADRGLVDVLFATMAQAVPKRAAAKRVLDSVMRESRQYGVKTEFFVGSSVDKTLLVWGDEKTGVTYFIDDKENVPFVMAIPGYRVFVGGIFAQGVNTWRDKRIFNFNWRNFTSLQTSFPRDPNQSFKVAFTERFFSIEGISNIDTTTLNNYLDAVSLIEGDEFYVPGSSGKYDSLIKTTPIMTIQVTEASGGVQSLELFPIAGGQQRALTRWGNDYVWFDRRNILQIYKRKKEFIKQ